MTPESQLRNQADGEPGMQATVSYRQVAPQPRSSRYSLKRFHARGGMGEVWLAEDHEINRLVALKKLRSDHPGSEERFVAEAQITGQLEHPAVVPVHDFGLDEDGKRFYTMMFVHGRTLRDAIHDFHSASGASDSDRQVNRLQLLKVFVDLCQAVAFAHSRGVLHRDLKPDNVMLGQYGETFVLDWGLAKVLDQPEAELPSGSSYVRITRSGGSSETQAGSVMGAPPYMAPEVADGRIDEVDTTTDVYLLGGCLYHILTGDTPRRGSSRAEMVDLARTVDPVRPRSKNKDVPRALEAVCQKAMARRKQDRYQTAQELAQDVQQFLAGEPVSAYREGIFARTWRWAKRHRRAIGRFAVAALVVSVALFGFFMWRSAKQFESRELAREQVKVFREAADEAFYLAANSDASSAQFPYNLDEELAADSDASNAQFPYYNLEAARQHADDALETARPWGPRLELLPLAEERAGLRDELHDLLLRKVWMHLNRSPDEKTAKEMLRLLEQAASLGQPTRGFYRLRMQCYRMLNDEAKALEDQSRAEDTNTSQSAQDHFLLGEEHRTAKNVPTPQDDPLPLTKRDLGPALEEYQTALSLDPEHYWSRYQSARCLLAEDRAAEAVEALGACIALHPDSPWPYSTRGFALAVQGRYTEALADLDWALGLRAEFYPAMLHRGFVHWRQGDLERAIQDFNKVLETPEKKRLIHAAYYLGHMRLEKGKLRQALTHFRQFVNQSERSAPASDSVRDAYRRLAEIRYLLGSQAAVQDLNRFLALGFGESFDPESGQACYDRGRFLAALARSAQAGKVRGSKKKILGLALAEFQKAEVDQPSADLFRDMGVVLVDLGRLDNAAAEFSKGIDIAPNNLELLTSRGFVYYLLIQNDKAVQDYTRATRIAPKSKAEQALLSEAHALLGYFSAASKDSPAAELEAAFAMLALDKVDKGQEKLYLVFDNMACIYGELAKSDEKRRHKLENIALALLQEATVLAIREGKVAIQLQFIKNEAAFGPGLRARPQFNQIIQQL